MWLVRVSCKPRGHLATMPKIVLCDVLQLIAEWVVDRFTSSPPSGLFRTRNYRAVLVQQNRRSAKTSGGVENDFDMSLLRGVADRQRWTNTIRFPPGAALVGLIKLLYPAHANVSQS